MDLVPNNRTLEMLYWIAQSPEETTKVRGARMHSSRARVHARAGSFHTQPRACAHAHAETLR
eukprot:6182966-Pleurochrysis_carterae.AAC.3